MKPMVEQLSKILSATSIQTMKSHKLSAFLQASEDDGLSLKGPAQGSMDIGGGGHSDGIMSTLEGMKTKAEDQLSAARKGAWKLSTTRTWSRWQERTRRGTSR